MSTYAFTSSAIQAGGTPKQLIAGEAIAAGELLYRKSDDGKLYKALANGTLEQSTIYGIAVASAAIGQHVAYLSDGVITVQASAFDAIGVGGVLVLSQTAGAAMDVGDLASDDWLAIVGWVTGANTFKFKPVNTGVQVA